MMKLTKNNLDNLITGASLLATGGGGSIASAKKIASKVKKPLKMVNLGELKKSDLLVTVFGVGGSEKNDPVVCSRIALKAFREIFKNPIKAIIPVEIGPLAVATAAFIAAENNLLLANADIVGFRSSPEVFLETISMPGLSREPAVIVNEKNDVLILLSSQSIEQTENIFRNFATLSGGDAFVVGYPLLVKDVNKVVGKGSLSFAISLGERLKNIGDKNSFLEFCRDCEFQFFSTGKVKRENKKTDGGFTTGTIVIADKNRERFQVFVKNENIVLRKKKEVLLTTPDSICLLDSKTRTGINNFENNTGKEVIILGRKALLIWRTEKGKKLFSPKNLGFNINQKLLK